jgi:tRNA-2-methylthio-N6-dimethylallyladenosine synthase
MNVHDSEGISGVLMAEGYQPVADEADADVVLINTCAVRAKPERKVEAKIGALSARRRDATLDVLGICGCMAQEHGQALLDRYPQLDFVCGTGNLSAVPRLIRSALAGQRGSVLDMAGDVAVELPREHGSRYRAYVDIIYGCTNFCSYCIVPYVRGPERSRPVDEVLDEVRRLAEGGWIEVTLLGQNVNSYGRDLPEDAPRFSELLRRVDAIDRLRRVRFTTSHPRDCDAELLETMAELESVCEHLHLPVQAGDDEILARMNRGYTHDQYLALVESAREAMPGLSLTTDVIVGFPGETRRQFEETLRLFEEVRYDSAFSFIYVPRPGTAAAEMDDPVPHEEKVEWLKELATRQKDISRERNQPLVGETVEVLVDGPSEGDPTKLSGRTRTNKLVIFGPQGAAEEGDLVHVRTTQAKLWGFEGELAEGDRAGERRSDR